MAGAKKFNNNVWIMNAIQFETVTENRTIKYP